MTNKIMEYLQNTFNGLDNSFVYNTFENMIDYAVKNFNSSKDQLAYYLSDIIDELEFEEIRQVIIDSFEPHFYTMNLVNGAKIEKEAIKVLNERCSKEEQYKIKNYDEIGIVEYVANNNFDIIDNKIIPENRSV